MSRQLLQRIAAVRKKAAPRCPQCAGEPIRVVGDDREGNVVDSMPAGHCPACGMVAIIEIHTPGLDHSRI